MLLRDCKDGFGSRKYKLHHQIYRQIYMEEMEVKSTAKVLSSACRFKSASHLIPPSPDEYTTQSQKVKTLAHNLRLKKQMNCTSSVLW